MTDTLFIPPLAHSVADEGAFDDWLGRARRGDEFRLAMGRVRPIHSPVWLAAKMAEAAQLLRIVAIDAGALDGGGWEWRAEWIAARDGDGVGAAARVTLRRAGGGRRRAEPTTGAGEAVTDAMLRIIRRAANLGKPAPSLAALSKAAELPARQNAQHWLHELVTRQCIRIETDRKHSAGERRRFLIIDGHGKVTGTTDWAALRAPKRED